MFYNIKIKMAFLITIISNFIIVSCSNDNIDLIDTQNSPTLTNYIFKTYNITNTPNTTIDSLNYKIENNRILNISGINFETSDVLTSNYSYSNNQLTNVHSFVNNILNKTETFSYNSNGDLIEYISESISNNQISTLNKLIFNHTLDTIFSTLEYSNDGLSFTNISNFKIILDGNNNRTFFEEYNYFNDEIKQEINEYDENLNVVNESHYLLAENAPNTLSFQNNYTYNTSTNLFYTINERTYTRKNLMLLFHLQSDAVNEINVKSISRNNIITFQSTWGNSFVNFDITNTTNQNNITILSDYKTIINDNVLSRFSQEYLLE